MTRTPRLALMVNIIAPYRLPIYKALGQAFDLTVYISGSEGNRSKWAGTITELEQAGVRIVRPWGVTFQRSVRQGGRVQDLRYLHITPGYLSALFRDRPDAVITNELGTRTIFALLYGLLTHRPVWVWWGGTLHTERGRGRLKRILRDILVHWVQRWISYGESSTTYLSKLGVPREHILQIQNAVNEATYSKPVPALMTIQPRPVLLYVGQMIGRKGVSALMESAARIQHEGYVFTLLLVGGGPEQKELEQLAAVLNLRNVHFLPPQAPEGMPAVYRSADCLVFPTLEDVWGLVVNEALWSGLTVLSSVYAGCTEEIVPEQNRFDPLNADDFDRALRLAVTGGLAKADTSPLLPTSEVSERIASDIRRRLGV
ncbi:glycosyltransferase family 4 protein [Deinococcus peraridilitoris]|uniref:Glycosyltransferase n=1 Tax=Deinococcus peraridilitoris (strain DSM 19664 / LMG 22246 / CIP 109416 / KR-200) TaxID=937777 RepID=L0A6P4_DEIPD|nr:glycosyltransferase family 4 protein [Deinococcus peraridilitoris]AFZ69516.1 glycosyltransferase [Deinococcus peraridilitoris DSM 19664]